MGTPSYEQPLTREGILKSLAEGRVSYRSHTVSGEQISPAQARAILLHNIDRFVNPEEHRLNLEEFFVK